MGQQGEKQSNTAAKIAYRPLGLVSSLIGGLLAGIVFKQVWGLVKGEKDAPGALESEYSWNDVLLAAAVEGAIFAVVKAAVDRGGARAFERWTGEWPGD